MSVALVVVGLLAACAEPPPDASARAPSVGPPPTRKDLLGTWVGTMLTEQGHRTVVLEIRAVVRQGGHAALSYRLNLSDLREDGVARLRPAPEGGYRICFGDSTCGWLVFDPERGFRFSSERRAEGPVAWELVRLGDAAAPAPGVSVGVPGSLP